MLAHVFPNILPLMVVVAAIDVATLILAESFPHDGHGGCTPKPRKLSVGSVVATRRSRAHQRARG